MSDYEIMKKRILLLFCILCLCMVYVLTACNGSNNDKKPEPTEDPRVYKDQLQKVEPREDQHVTFQTTDDGYDVYAPLEGQWGYRYGPSIIYYPDGAWTHGFGNSWYKW